MQGKSRLADRHERNPRFYKKYGRKQTIGRVQTPTLAMLAERQAKIQNFVKEPYYKVELSGAGVVAASEQMAQEQDADTMQAACDGQCAVVGSIERKRVEKKPPKLYDLTTLQREANRYYGLTASQTLQALQELYEEKLVTYPRTDSQFVTEDMRTTVESLVLALDGTAADVSCVINNSRVTDHHAILPTMQGAKCDKAKLLETKQKILSLIIWKLVQAVQPPFIYEDVLVTVCCQGRNFTAKYKDVLQPGYTAKPVPLVEPEKNKDALLPNDLEQGMVIPVVQAEKSRALLHRRKFIPKILCCRPWKRQATKSLIRTQRRKVWEHRQPVLRFWKSWYLPAMYSARASR